MALFYLKSKNFSPLPNHGGQRQILVLLFNMNYWQNLKQKYAMEKLKDIFNFIMKTCPKTALLYYFS